MTKQHSEAVLGIGSGGKVIGGEVKGDGTGVVSAIWEIERMVAGVEENEDGGVTVDGGMTGGILCEGVVPTTSEFGELETGGVGTEVDVGDGEGREELTEGGTGRDVGGNGGGEDGLDTTTVLGELNGPGVEGGGELMDKGVVGGVEGGGVEMIGVVSVTGGGTGRLIVLEGGRVDKFDELRVDRVDEVGVLERGTVDRVEVLGGAGGGNEEVVDEVGIV